MSLLHVAFLLVYALGLLLGQVLFKFAAVGYSSHVSSSLLEKGWFVLTNIYFILAVALYFGLSVFWIWLLTQVPLSKAYPFVAINFILTAVAGVAFFGERVSSLNMAGLLMITGGIVLATR